MNQTDLDIRTRTGGWLFRRVLSRLVVGLGAYSAIVLTSISLLMILAVIVGNQQATRTEQLVFLLPPAIWLLLYSTFTTKATNKTISYKLGQILKRFFDVTISSLGLFFLGPVMILIALCMKLASPGPAFNRSKRVGQYGRLFDMYEFRTRSVTESNLPLTHFGRFLRQSSLDTLPIFYNVLEGELSLVGPRPRQPADMKDTLDAEKRILSVKPGLTGLWQVSYLPVPDPRQMIDLDLKYVEERSLRLDLGILVRTVFVVLRRMIL